MKQNKDRELLDQEAKDHEMKEYEKELLAQDERNDIDEDDDDNSSVEDSTDFNESASNFVSARFIHEQRLKAEEKERRSGDPNDEKWENRRKRLSRRRVERLTPVERQDTTSKAPGQNKRASKRMGRKRMSNENPDLPGAIRIGRQRESKRDYSPTPAQMSSTNLEQIQTQSKSSSQLTETSSTESTKASVIEAKLVEDYEDDEEKRKKKEYQDIVVATVDTGNPVRRRLCGVLVVIILAAIIFGIVRLTSSPKPSGVADDEELPLVYDPPTVDDCEAIANGEKLFNQTEAIQEPLYVSTDVSIVSDGYDMESLLPDLSDAMKQYFAPALAGCFDKDRRRNLRRRLSRNPKFSVLNTDIELEYDDDNECNFDSPKPCYRIIVKLNLYLKGQEYISDLMSLIYGYGRDPPLVETLRLDDDASPYTSIIFAAINQPSS